MKIFRKLVIKITTQGFHRYCSCGHTVSANLAFCPHCGRWMRGCEEIPMD